VRAHHFGKPRVQAIGRQPQRAPDGAPVHCERHRRGLTRLYCLVQQHVATFFAQAEDAAGADLPQFAKDEFEAFLECGVLAHGFLCLRCGEVFRYAVASGLMESDPSRDLRGALPPWRPEHYPTLTDPRKVGQLLRDINAYEGGFITRCAMKLAPLLFVRPGELRRAEWSEFNLDTKEWRIPASKVKASALHIVPLAPQAMAVLAETWPLTGGGKWRFPGVRMNGDPMSENTINAALRRMGYDRATLSAHVFRGMASTMLHEFGWPSDAIERQLSHAERNTVKAAYNHAEHLPERRKGMNAWADHLDKPRLNRTGLSDSRPPA